jgi:hypothetical protein
MFLVKPNTMNANVRLAAMPCANISMSALYTLPVPGMPANCDSDHTIASPSHLQLVSPSRERATSCLRFPYEYQHQHHWKLSYRVEVYDSECEHLSCPGPREAVEVAIAAYH